MIRDALGREFARGQPPRRIVSLVPSITETLFELGVGADVVGITDFCIFPPGLTLPRVGGTKNPRVDQIRALAPDLVHVNLEENLRRHAEQIEEFAPVFVSEPKTLDDVHSLFATFGAIHACGERAAAIAGGLQREQQLVQHRTFTFACAIWKEPWMWCGGDTYVSSLVEAAGGTNVLADSRRYPSMDLTSVLALQPDIVFLPDEPYAFTQRDADEVMRSGSARVVGPFPGHLFTWHGSRSVLGLRFLRELQIDHQD